MLSMLDSYEVIRTRARGKLSVLKQVRDPKTNEFFAAKLIKSASDSVPAEHQELLRREYSFHQQMSNPRVVNCIRYVESGLYHSKSGRAPEPCTYLLLEFCPNGDLFDLVYYSGKFDESTARFYFRQILEIISLCQSSGIVHNGIRGENLLLDGNFHLKLSDFSHTLQVDTAEQAPRSQSNSERYLAPEILSGQTRGTFGSDLFAAGVVLYVLVMHNFPFQKSDTFDRSFKRLKTEPAKYWNLNKASHLSQDFKDLIECLLVERIPYESVETHSWLSGPERSFLLEEATRRRNTAVEAAEREKAKRRETRRDLIMNNGRFFRGDLEDSDSMSISFTFRDEDLVVKQIGEFKVAKFSSLVTGLLPHEVMKVVSHSLGICNAETAFRTHKCEVKASVVTDDDSVDFVIRLFAIGEDLNLLDFRCKEGNPLVMMEVFNLIRDKIEEAQMID